ncbi:MAG TPA: helix-turn-helix domain-containing protein [Gemmatimonadaceae bacterium]|nr:helix-turn-helix domain-containing protein [Gemmatimonadaceae bacterium]
MASSVTADSTLTPIATMLLPPERLRVDAAGEGLYRTVHRDSIDDVMRDLREHRVRAVVVSVARCGGENAPHIARLVREFPRIPAVALLTQTEPATPHAVLSLGQSGVRTLVDVRRPTGWRELREVLIADRAQDIERLALGTLALDLVGASDECWRFFEALFRSSSHIPTVRALAAQLTVLPNTLMSRFFRAHLPAPKRYLAMARLTLAARIFENPGLSVANVANHLDYSSPQSFGRHVRTFTGFTAVAFRQHYDGEGMLHRFRDELVLPYLPVLRCFNPLSVPPRWRRRSRAVHAPASSRRSLSAAGH